MAASRQLTAILSLALLIAGPLMFSLHHHICHGPHACCHHNEQGEQQADSKHDCSGHSSHSKSHSHLEDLPSKEPVPSVTSAHEDDCAACYLLSQASQSCCEALPLNRELAQTRNLVDHANPSLTSCSTQQIRGPPLA